MDGLEKEEKKDGEEDELAKSSQVSLRHAGSDPSHLFGWVMLHHISPRCKLHAVVKLSPKRLSLFIIRAIYFNFGKVK